MSCEFTPTVTLNLNQYEGLLNYKEYFETELDAHIQTKLDLEAMTERWKEAVKLKDEYKRELEELRRYKTKMGERYDAD